MTSIIFIIYPLYAHWEKKESQLNPLDGRLVVHTSS